MTAQRSAMTSTLRPAVAATPEDEKKRKLVVVGGLGLGGPSNVADVISFA